MLIYNDLPKKDEVKNCESKEKILRKTFSIDDVMYDKLKYLSNNIYDVSINKLVNIAIDDLIKTENIKLYTTKYKENRMDRTYLISEESLKGLEKLKIKYKLPITRLINIAVHNAIEGEEVK